MWSSTKRRRKGGADDRPWQFPKLGVGEVYTISKGFDTRSRGCAT